MQRQMPESKEVSTMGPRVKFFVLSVLLVSCLPLFNRSATAQVSPQKPALFASFLASSQCGAVAADRLGFLPEVPLGPSKPVDLTCTAHQNCSNQCVVDCTGA